MYKGDRPALIGKENEKYMDEVRELVSEPPIFCIKVKKGSKIKNGKGMKTDNQRFS